MKRLYLLMAILLCSTSLIVFAEEGNVKVYTFKAWINEERLDVDWSSEGFETAPGKTLELQIRLENNHNETIDVEMEGTFYDLGEDIKREKAITIDEDEKKTIVFEYYIPTDTKEGVYDLEIKYEYDAKEYSGNTSTTKTYKHEKIFSIDMRVPKMDTNEILVNLTGELANSRKENNELLSTVIDITNITISLDKCREDLTNERLEGEFKSKYEEELEKSRDSENKLGICTTERDNRPTQAQMDTKIQTAENTARREQKSKGDWYVILTIIGFYGYYNWYKPKKEKVGGEGEGKSIFGAKW